MSNPGADDAEMSVAMTVVTATGREFNFHVPLAAMVEQLEANGLFVVREPERAVLKAARGLDRTQMGLALDAASGTTNEPWAKLILAELARRETEPRALECVRIPPCGGVGKCRVCNGQQVLRDAGKAAAAKRKAES